MPRVWSKLNAQLIAFDRCRTRAFQCSHEKHLSSFFQGRFDLLNFGTGDVTGRGSLNFCVGLAFGIDLQSDIRRKLRFRFQSSFSRRGTGKRAG